MDPDLASIRSELRGLREEYKATENKAGVFGLPSFKNPLKDLSESIGVEWKD